MDKQYIKESLNTIGYDIEGSLDHAINWLAALPNSYPEHSNFSLSYDYGWSDDKNLTLYGERLETDREYTLRTKKEAKEELLQAQTAQKQANAEKALYEKLKKKYEQRK